MRSSLRQTKPDKGTICMKAQTTIDMSDQKVTDTADALLQGINETCFTLSFFFLTRLIS